MLHCGLTPHHRSKHVTRNIVYERAPTWSVKGQNAAWHGGTQSTLNVCGGKQCDAAESENKVERDGRTGVGAGVGKLWSSKDRVTRDVVVYGRAFARPRAVSVRSVQNNGPEKGRSICRTLLCNCRARYTRKSHRKRAGQLRLLGMYKDLRVAVPHGRPPI